MASAEGLAQPVPACLAVDLVYAAAPHEVWRLALTLAAGATVADALRESGWAARLGAAVLDSLALSVWNRACTSRTPLRDGDRIELSRPLTVDPKEARRQRYRRDGLRKRQR